jgi:hypothetical protein
VLDAVDALHDIKLGTVDVVRQQRGVRGSTRQLDLVAAGVDHKAVRVVLHENPAHIADVVRHACNDQVRVILGRHVGMQCSAAQNVVPCKGDQHGVLDIVVQRIAVADAFQSDAGDRRHQLNEAAFRGAVSPLHVLCEKTPECICRQLRNGHHDRLLLPTVQDFEADLPAWHAFISAQ